MHLIRARAHAVIIGARFLGGLGEAACDDKWQDSSEVRHGGHNDKRANKRIEGSGRATIDCSENC